MNLAAAYLRPASLDPLNAQRYGGRRSSQKEEQRAKRTQ